MTTVTIGDRDVSVVARADGFWEWFSAGTWEPWTLRTLRDRLRPGSRYVDVGAWVGPTVLTAAAQGATVEAFEPDPAALDELNRNLAANPELAERVTVHPVALAAATGSRTLSFRNSAGDSMSSLAHKGEEGVSVAVDSVTTWLTRPEFRDAELVKIDIEGGEYDLVPAMRDHLQNCKPDLLLSLHSWHLDDRVKRLPARLRRPAQHALVLQQRRRIAWLTRTYPSIYVATADKVWKQVDVKWWRRLLHEPNNLDLFLSTRPLSI